MPYKVYSPTFDVEGGPRDRNCDVRVKARVAKLETTGRGAPRAVVATGVVTFTLAGQPAKTGDTDENGIATALFENVSKQRDESRLRLEAVFRSQDGETASADPIRITIPPAPRVHDDQTQRGPRLRLYFENPELFTSKGKTFALLQSRLVRKTKDAEGKPRDIGGVPKIPVYFKLNGKPYTDDPTKYEHTDPNGRVLFHLPVEKKDEEQRVLVQAVAQIDQNTTEESEVKTLVIQAKGKTKVEHTLKVTGQPMGEEDNFYFLVQAKLEGPNIKDIPVGLSATLWDRAGNPVQIPLGADLRTDDSGEIMVPTRMIDWQDWEQDIFFGGHANIGGQEALLSRIDHKKIPKRKEPDAKILRIEPAKLGDGHYRLTFCVFNEHRKGVAAKIRIVPNAEFALGDTTTATKEKVEVSIPDTGIKDDQVRFGAERLELDVFVLGTDIRQQLTLLGPKPKRKPAKPGDGFFAHLTDGWE